MVGLGTIINSAAIIVGGVFGHLFGKILNERIQDSLQKASGICVLFIGIAGAMEGMLKLSGSSLSAGRSMLIVASLALGALVGEILNIEHGFERFGEWLKVKTGNAKDKSFVEGFVTASLTVCIGAMAVVGSIKDGISGDYSILVTKAILDLIIITVMTCSLGKGCAFSAIPVECKSISLVGSSSSMSLECPASSLQRATLCFSPPERFFAFLFSSSPSSKRQRSSCASFVDTLPEIIIFLSTLLSKA